MAGDMVQVGADDAVRIQDDGIVVGGDSDPCCCSAVGPYFVRLLNCCTGVAADIVIDEAVRDIAAVVIDNATRTCYTLDPPDPYGSGIDYTNDAGLVDVDTFIIPGGWTILTDYQIVATTWGYDGGPGCDAAGCNAIYVAARRYCDSSDTGLWGFIIPPEGIETVAEYLATVIDKFFEYDGAWWQIYDVIAVPWCDQDAWYAENGDLVVSSTLPDLYDDLDPNVCCNVYEAFGGGGCEIPCCLQLTFTDFDCPNCSPPDPMPDPAPTEWNKVLSVTGDGDYAYSGTDPGRTGCTISGTLLPGTDCVVTPRLYWEEADGFNKWRLELGDGYGGIYWGGYGSSDPCDPTGTYTFDGFTFGSSTVSPVIPSPGCPNGNGASMPSTQPGSGPSTITVAKKTIP